MKLFKITDAEKPEEEYVALMALPASEAELLCRFFEDVDFKNAVHIKGERVQKALDCLFER